MIDVAELPVKERILKYSTERFFREGFSKVSVDELSSELGISKKTFYKCFESKDDLLSQIVDRLLAEIESAVVGITNGNLTFVQKLDAFMAFVGNQIARVFRPFMLEIQRYAPHLWYRVQEFRRERMTRNFMAIIEEGMKAGYIRTDLNGRILFLAFLGAVEGLLVPSVLANESFSADEAMRGILQIFFRGILTPDAGQQLLPLRNNQLPQQS